MAPRRSTGRCPSQVGSSGGHGPSFGEGGVQDGANETAIVFGESTDTLYKVDPLFKVVTVVGKFDGCTYVTDIALERDSNMFGTTVDGLYKIDPMTAACTLIASGTYPNSLSFVPAGTLDPSAEALVGYIDAQYVRIDLQTGAMKNVGQGLGMGLPSSGDIVSVNGGGHSSP